MQLLSFGIASFSSEFLPEDDVDRIFKKLQKREPPANIVEQILNRIHQMPPERIHQLSPKQEKPRASAEEQ